VLLLDEPTAGLDEPTAAALIADVLAATEGTTVILVTHRSADLAGFSDVVEIEAGRGTPSLASPPARPQRRACPSGAPDLACGRVLARRPVARAPGVASAAHRVVLALNPL